MPRWDLTHNPDKRPLGCNGKPGVSGRDAHKARGEPPCEKCKAAVNHTKRERNRGQTYPKRLKPCGTDAAAARHRKRKEPLDVPCQIAEAAAQRARKARRKG